MLVSSKRGAVLLLVTGVLVAAALPVPATAKATKAPVGVWAGPGDQDGDYAVLAIANGPAGRQPTFYVEQIGGCGDEPMGVYGTSSYDAGALTFTWLDPCGGQTLTVTFTRDPGADTWNMMWNNAVVSTLTRRCGPDDGLGGPVTHEGTPGDDVLTGTEGNDVMDGKGGNDTLIGRGGIDILCGQAGKDVLKGGAGTDIILGAGGNDKVIGGAGWDFGTGGGGKDVMKGNGGTDVLLGERKPDRIYGGAGPNDVAIGGPGADVCRAEIKVSC